MSMTIKNSRRLTDQYERRRHRRGTSNENSRSLLVPHPHHRRPHPYLATILLQLWNAERALCPFFFNVPVRSTLFTSARIGIHTRLLIASFMASYLVLRHPKLNHARLHRPPSVKSQARPTSAPRFFFDNLRWRLKFLSVRTSMVDIYRCVIYATLSGMEHSTI